MGVGCKAGEQAAVTGLLLGKDREGRFNKAHHAIRAHTHIKGSVHYHLSRGPARHPEASGKCPLCPQEVVL